MNIKYFIPDDGDDIEHPNIFEIKQITETSAVTLAQIKSNFPLPGSYHFRFLTNIGSTNVWLDLTDDSRVVPLHSGGIFAKISRVENRRSDESSHQQRPGAFVPTTVASASLPNPSKTAELLFDDFNTSSTTSSASNIPSASPISAVKSFPADPFFADNDLLGITSPTSKPSSSTPSIDLFTLDTLQPKSSPNIPAPVMLNNSMIGGFPIAGGSAVMGLNVSQGMGMSRTGSGGGFDAFNSLNSTNAGFGQTQSQGYPGPRRPK